MSLERDEGFPGTLKDSNDAASYHSSIRGNTLGRDSPPSLVPGEDGTPTQLQMIGDMPDASEDKDPFDTTSPKWTYGGHLAASLQSDDDIRKRTKSAQMSVLFDNLRVIGAGSGATYQNSVGETALAPVKIAQSLFSRKKDLEKTILYGIDGVVRAGEMLLVLGRPGSGCSTLLKTLAGFNEGYVGYEGGVKYNGVDVDIVKRRFRADVAYNADGSSRL
jgi:ABC-type multidrug transport system fused ATPase/permease subunit